MERVVIDTLSEARKYGLVLILAHRNLSQLLKNLQDSILTNCSIQYYFRVCRRDTEILAKETFETIGLEVEAVGLGGEYLDYDWFSYAEEWEKYIQKLKNLPNRCFYAKHKIEGGVFYLLGLVMFYQLMKNLGSGRKSLKSLWREYCLGRSISLVSQASQRAVCEPNQPKARYYCQKPQQYPEFFIWCCLDIFVFTDYVKAVSLCLLNSSTRLFK
jgi:hypothetical protein